jgi:hypothetical protein
MFFRPNFLFGVFLISGFVWLLNADSAIKFADDSSSTNNSSNSSSSGSTRQSKAILFNNENSGNGENTDPRSNFASVANIQNLGGQQQQQYPAEYYNSYYTNQNNNNQRFGGKQQQQQQQLLQRPYRPQQASDKTELFYPSTGSTGPSAESADTQSSGACCNHVKNFKLIVLKSH